jgi:hypothetical protein
MVVGSFVQVTWTPCNENGQPLSEEEAYVEKEEDMIGRPWNAIVRIRWAPQWTDPASS